ncbi:MAG: DUF4097 family beta strand repeat-containing protein [Halanaerobium sp.]|nr:DUF4097 family beta strand repeat-containing protein [Halanaerobium sp.]
MKEERMKILKMLDEGTITVEEANELLDTLGFTEQIGEIDEDELLDYGEEPEAGKEEPRKNQAIDDIKKETKELIKDLKERGKKLKDSFDAETKEEIMANVDEIKKSIGIGLEEGMKGLKVGLEEGKKALSSQKGLFQSLFQSFGFFGEGRKTEWKLDGNFPGEGIKEVSLSTMNGRIQVEPSPEDRYRVLIKGEVRGVETDEEALEKLKESLEVVREDNKLSIRAQGGSRVSASIYLNLPARETYNLEMHSTNGRIVVEDLRSQEIKSETTNGRVVLAGVTAKRATLGTVNGRIEVTDADLDGLSTESVNGSTYVQGLLQDIKVNSTNGSINLELTGKEELNVQVANNNGRVKLLLPAEEEYAFTVDAKSSMGSLNVDLPGLEVEKDIARTDKKQIIASKESEHGKKVTIKTRNSMGSTYIGLK